MINPVGSTIGAVMYLSFVNISFAASYDVNSIAVQQLDNITTRSLVDLAFIETPVTNTAAKPMFSSGAGIPSVSSDTFSLSNQTPKHSSQQYKHFLIALLATGFCFLAMSYRHRTKVSIFF